MLSVQHCSPSILDDFYQPKVEHEILWLAGIAAAATHSLGNSQRCFFVCMGIPNLNLFLLPVLNGEREGMSLLSWYVYHMYIIFLLIIYTIYIYIQYTCTSIILTHLKCWILANGTIFAFLTKVLSLFWTAPWVPSTPCESWLLGFDSWWCLDNAGQR